MGEIAGPEINGVKGNEEVDGVLVPAQVMAGGIKLRPSDYLQRQ